MAKVSCLIRQSWNTTNAIQGNTKYNEMHKNNECEITSDPKEIVHIQFASNSCLANSTESFRQYKLETTISTLSL